MTRKAGLIGAANMLALERLIEEKKVGGRVAPSPIPEPEASEPEPVQRANRRMKAKDRRRDAIERERKRKQVQSNDCMAEGLQPWMLKHKQD